LAAQLTRDPKPLHEISAGIPRSLSTLIMRCLAKDPAQRPQTADEILHELDSMTMPLGSSADATVATAARSKRSWMGAAAVAILVAAIGGVGYVVTHSRQQPPAVAAPTLPPPPTVKLADTSAKPPIVPPKAPAAKPVLTHADSVRIAEIVRKRIEAAKLSDSIAKAKLAEVEQRKLMDSIIAANSGGASTGPVGPRRIVIAEAPDVRGWPEATLLGRAVADSLRRMLKGRPQQYIVVDADSTRSVLARSRDAGEISRTLNAELIVAVRLLPTRGDSAVLALDSFDVGAAPQFAQRSAGGRRTPKNQVLTGLDQTLLSTLTNLEVMTRSARRPQPPGTP
jgi:uncharacterized membrane protein YebE (DUF533 family)